METIFSHRSLSPLFDIKRSPSWQPRSNSVFCTKSITCSPRKNPSLSLKPSLPASTSWFTHAQQGLAALALSLALNFSPLWHSSNALASEFDVLNEGPPKESYVVDDAGVLSRVTKSDLKQLLTDLESRKNFHINFITVRKLTISKADAFEYADQILERWYFSVEEGNNKGVVVLVTSQKEGAITGGPAFVQAVGENVLDATVSENLPVLATDEKYNEAIFIALPNGSLLPLMAFQILVAPSLKTTSVSLTSNPGKKRTRNVDNLLLVIAFVVPMAQYYAYVSKK